jgi:predicted transcriptional regulator
MENNNAEKKEIIIDILKKSENPISTTEISSIISRDFYFTSRLLDDMASENLIKKISVNKFTYWDSQDGKRI